MPTSRSLTASSSSDDSTIIIKHPLISKRYKEFLCGACASMVNTSITYPISKVIFRQQIYGLATVNALHQVHSEGIRYLYRGVMFPLLQRGATMSIMFGTYHSYSNWLLLRWPYERKTGVKSLAAFMAGVSEAIFTPFERLQSLMQHKGYNRSVSNSVNGFKLVWRYGVREFYKGLTLIIFRNGLSNILFFGIKDILKSTAPPPSKYQFVYNFSVGSGLGAFLSTIFYPVNVVKNRLQSTVGYDSANLFQLFARTYREKGGSLKTFYKGVHLNYGRAILSWGIVNTVYEYLTKVL